MDTQNVHMARMHGCGNRFIVVDDTNNRFQKNYQELYCYLSKHYVFDQLLVVISEEIYFYFEIINKDGSQGKQCLNGARCIAHYLVSKRLTSSNVFTLSNASGLISVAFNDASSISLSLTMPVMQGFFEGGICVDAGNPHIVFFSNALSEIDVDHLGAGFQKKFPEGINVGFVECVDRNTIRLRTYERGCGETEACGSSALACVFAGITSGKLNNNVIVNFYSGDYLLNINSNNEKIEMIGPSCLIEEFIIPLKKINNPHSSVI